MKILYIAEIVGKAGVYACKKALPGLKKKLNPDFVFICADGATGGNGLGRNHAAYLHKLSGAIITTGECCFYKKDLTENLDKIPYVLRPENLNDEAPGIGFKVFRNGNQKLGAAVLLGQSCFSRIHANSPFTILPGLLKKIRQETPYVFIDFHAQTTAEKQTLFAIADGSCSAVIGSHCRIQTADERVLPGGCAVITDAGRTGSVNSVGGCDSSSRIREYLSGIPDWTRESWEEPELQGVFIELGKDGKALSIERICCPIEEKPAMEESADTDGEGALADE